MKNSFSKWIGQSVVFKVDVGNESVPLRGIVIGETHDAVRFRIGDGWDVDIYKAMIREVEEETWVSLIT